MTIDEVIRHAEEVAEGLEKTANTYGIKRAYIPKSQEPVDCISCAADHRQLAEWLKEYKELREKQEQLKRILKNAMSDIYKKCSCDNSDCDICERKTCDYDDRFTWRLEKEAFDLIYKRGDAE